MPGYYSQPQAEAYLFDYVDTVIDSEDTERDYEYNNIFDVKDWKRGEYVSYRTGGMELPQRRQRLEDLAPVNYTEGERQATRPVSYGCQFGIPMELLRDIRNMGPLGGDNLEKIGSYGDFVRRQKDNFYWRADIQAAAKFLNGTSTAADYVGRDGKAWFSASQTTLSNPAVTQSNVTTNAPFTPANIMTAISALRVQRDDNGRFLRKPRKFTVVTSEAHAWRAKEIVDTDRQVDSGNNNANPLYKENIKHVIWNELGPTYTGWFVLADSAMIKFLWFERPVFARDVDNSARAHKYYASAQFNLVHEHWLGAIGFPSA